MTVCISAICDGGRSVVSASDCMVTNSSLAIQFEQPTRKMTRLSEGCVALTAGDALAHTELFNDVIGAVGSLKNPDVLQIVEAIKRCYQGTRKKEITEIFLQPRGFDSLERFYGMMQMLPQDLALAIQSQIDSYNYGLQIIVAGLGRGSSHIHGIFEPGTSKCFDSIGFHAIGSGSAHAVNTLIAREIHRTKSIEEGIMIVYEAKKSAEKAPGVGSLRTDICVLGTEKSFDWPQEKMRELDTVYRKWLDKDPAWEAELRSLLGSLEGVEKNDKDKPEADSV